MLVRVLLSFETNNIEWFRSLIILMYCLKVYFFFLTFKDANIFSGKEQQQRVQEMFTALHRTASGWS